MMTSEIDVTNSLNKTIQTPFSLKRCKTGGSDQPLEFSTSHSTILIGIEENIFDYVPCLYACFLMTIFIKLKYFHKKTGIYTRKILFILSFISWLIFHLIWKNYVLLYIQYIHRPITKVYSNKTRIIHELQWKMIKILTWKLEVWVFIHLSHAWKKTAKHLFLSKGLLTSKPKETWNLYNLYINCSLLKIKPCLWKIIHFHNYLIHFPKIVDQIVIFYIEILTGKVVLLCFFSSETSGKIHNSTFQVKISV